MYWKGSRATLAYVRFGSLADICGAKSDVRFTPNSDRESGFPQQAMSALAPEADMSGRQLFTQRPATEQYDLWSGHNCSRKA
jgi:hypothetical protein